MALDYNVLIAYIEGLYADESLSEKDYQDIINYILSNGDPETDPRDLIQIRRGNEEDLPNLAQGEICFTIDKENLFIGGLDGNVKINTKALYLNVRDFGAKGDGVNDDSVAFQECIDFAKDNLRSVFIPDGNYLIETPLIIYNETVIKGAGERDTIITSNVANGEFTIVAEESISRVDISDIKMIAATSKQNLVGGFDFKNMRYSNVDNVVVFYFTSAFKFDINCWANYFTNGRYWENTITFEFTDSGACEANNFSIQHCEIYDTDFGIKNIGGLNINISQNIFERAITAIQHSGKGQPFNIINNYFETCELILNIVGVETSKNFNIKENLFTRFGNVANGGALIQIEATTSSDPLLKSINIEGNHFKNNNGNSELIDIIVGNSENFVIDWLRNTFDNSYSSPIEFYLDLFTDTSVKPISHTKFKGFKSD